MTLDPPLDAGSGPRVGEMSLARRFLLANLVVVVVASLAVAAWVGLQLEKGVLDRTASVTALYIQSFVAPQIEAIGTSGTLPAANVDALDHLLSDTQLGERIVSFRVWTTDGVIAYSPNRDLIGRRFEPEAALAQALAGDVATDISDLSGPENAYERERWSRLVETYVPVRERGGPRIIAVTEFYQLPDEIDAEVASARLGSWTILALAALVSYLLLAGIVKGGSDTIDRQQRALRGRVAELTRLLDQNARLHRRLRGSAERTTALNEGGLRRIGSDLHDGPAQTMSLALLRLDELDGTTAVSEAIASALDDLRSIAAGLRSPAFDDLSVADIAERAVREHAAPDGTPGVADRGRPARNDPGRHEDRPLSRAPGGALERHAACPGRSRRGPDLGDPRRRPARGPRSGARLRPGRRPVGGARRRRHARASRAARRLVRDRSSGRRSGHRRPSQPADPRWSTGMIERLSIVVADDHPLYRDGVVGTLRSAGLDVVGEASIAREAIRLVRDRRPDLALFDVTMPGGGIAAAAEARAASPTTQVVMLTVSEDEDDLLAAIEAGASGYVLKGVAGRELVAILRRVARGERYVSSTLAWAALNRQASRRRTRSPS